MRLLAWDRQFREVAYRLHLYWQPPLAVEAPLLRARHLGLPGSI